MNPISVNYLAILTGAIASMVIGAIWYGPIFGKKWMEIIGTSGMDLETRKKMQKSMGPMYGLQFVLTLFQLFILATLAADTSGAAVLQRSLLIWAAFVIPTLAGAVMWTNEPYARKQSRFLIQAGYQLLMFVVFGLLLQLWK